MTALSQTAISFLLCYVEVHFRGMVFCFIPFHILTTVCLSTITCTPKFHGSAYSHGESGCGVGTLSVHRSCLDGDSITSQVQCVKVWGGGRFGTE